MFRHYFQLSCCIQPHTYRVMLTPPTSWLATSVSLRVRMSVRW